MKCPKCDNPKKLKAKLVDFDYSVTCGMPGVILEGVKQYTCPKCRTTFQDLGEADAITNAITDILLGQELLSRKAVKFIRSHVFEETYFEFSKRIEVNATVIREIENLKRPLSLEISRRIQDEVIRARALDVKISFEV